LLPKFMLALIDYGSGNIRSVENALRHEGADVRLVSTPEGLQGMSGVVLPGVGAFGDCAGGIRKRGLWDPIQQWLAADRPFLGICVGYQLLFDEGDESPGVRGFGFFGGRVKKFSTHGLKVPPIGPGPRFRASVSPLKRPGFRVCDFSEIYRLGQVRPR